MARNTGKLVLPVFPEVLDEIAVTWKDKPYTEKHPIVGSSLLDCEGMEAHSLRATCGATGRQPPPTENIAVIHGRFFSFKTYYF